MFNFFSSQKKQVEFVYDSPFLTQIKVDIHSHLIPSIDDGAADVTTSIVLIKELYRLGFRKIITTPHINEMYPNDNDSILDGLNRVNRLLKGEKLDIQLSVAAEYMVNDLFEKKLAADEPLLTLPNKHILIEMPHIGEPSNFSNVVATLQAKGYIVVLAHPERYRFYNNNVTAYQRLKDLGCKFQINALSLVGYYGKPIATCAWTLLNNYLVEFIGTDVHHPRQATALRTGITPEIHQLLNFYPFKNNQFLATEMPPKIELKTPQYELIKS